MVECLALDGTSMSPQALESKGRREESEHGGTRAQKDTCWVQQDHCTCELMTAMAVCTDLYKTGFIDISSEVGSGP